MDQPLDILVVDDLPEKRLAFQALLEPLGQRLTLVESGAEALRRILQQEFAIIVLDVNLPDMDGLEIARLIREHKRCRETPILFVSAMDDPQRIARAYELGAVDYIADPSVPGILRSKVKVFIDLILAQRQVRQAEREHIAALAAQELSRRKDDFIATLSHELRNPLTPMRNVIHILRRRFPGEPTIEQACGVLERQMARVTVLVDDLMDMSRIIRGKIHLERRRIDLRDVLQSSIESTQPLIEARRQLLSLDIADEAIWVDADPARLTQAFANVLNNAAKYTPEEGAIDVTLQRAARNVVISVRDNGMGIEPEALPRCFELFAQSDRSIRESQGGLGIGLAVVKELVQRHDGTVELASDGAGKGTLVRIMLPLKADAPARLDVPAAQRAEAAGRPSLH
jgi:signal transduction histidine kinase